MNSRKTRSSVKPTKEEANIDVIDMNPSRTKRARVKSAVSKVLPPYVTDPFIKTLVYLKAEHLVPYSEELVVSHRKESVLDMWIKMESRNLQALPVLNEDNRYYGYVTMFDIVRFVVNTFENASSATLVDLEMLFAAEGKLKNTLVHQIMEFPRKKSNPFHPNHVGSSLFSVWEKMSLLRLRRLPVINWEFELKDLITESMLIDFLWQNLSQIGDMASMSISDLKLYFKTVTTINSNVLAIEAFRMMAKSNIRGLAVVNNAGALVSDISQRDLRGVRPSSSGFWRLWSKTKEFKEKLKAEFPDAHIPESPVYVTPSDPLSKVVQIMAQRKITRIYVIDDTTSMIPTGVIGAQDVLAAILKQPAPHSSQE